MNASTLNILNPTSTNEIVNAFAKNDMTLKVKSNYFAVKNPVNSIEKIQSIIKSAGYFPHQISINSKGNIIFAIAPVNLPKFNNLFHSNVHSENSTDAEYSDESDDQTIGFNHSQINNYSSQGEQMNYQNTSGHFSEDPKIGYVPGNTTYTDGFSTYMQTEDGMIFNF